MRNKILISVVIIVAATILFAVLSKKPNSEKKTEENKATQEYESYSFNGNSVEAKDNTLIVKGLFDLGDKPNPQKEMITVEVSVNAETKITRVALKIPNTTERFDPDKLPKEETQVNFSQLATDSKGATLGIHITSSEEMFGKKKFTAKEIVYKVPIYSR